MGKSDHFVTFFQLRPGVQGYITSLFYGTPRSDLVPNSSVSFCCYLELIPQTQTKDTLVHWSVDRIKKSNLFNLTYNGVIISLLLLLLFRLYVYELCW